MYEERLVLFERDSLVQRFSWTGDRVTVPLADLVDRARGIDFSRCQRVTLAGNVPQSHPAFWELVGTLRERGAEEIALETTAASLAPDDAIDRLAQAGIDMVFPVIGAMRRGVYERVMRADELDAALAGIHRLSESGLRSYVTFPLLRGNERDAEALVQWLASMPKRLSGFLVSLPQLSTLPRPARRHVLDHADAAPLIGRLFAKAHDARLEYGFYDKRGLAPCAADRSFDRFGTVFHDRVRWLRHAPGEDLVRISACSDCSLEASCPGLERVYVEQFGETRLSPVPLDASMNWKLRKLNRLEQRDFKNVSAFDNQAPVEARGLLRINGHCNMSCSFCFVDRTVPDYDREQLKRDIRSLYESGARHLVLSGGEPTLHPDLADLIAHGRELSFSTLEIQTNGVKCEDLSYAEKLVASGLNKVTISLHSTDPAKSDEITRLPRAFERTIRGLHNVRSLGVETQIAHVITKNNYEDLPSFFNFLARELPKGTGRLSVCLAIAQGISDLVYTWVIPRFSEIKPYVRAALDIAIENDIGFGGMIGQGGYPPCMLDGELKYYRTNLENVFRSGDYEKQFYKAKRCETCSFDRYCLGVRRSYRDVYGDTEIRPFTAEIEAPAVTSSSVVDIERPATLLKLRRKAKVGL